MKNLIIVIHILLTFLLVGCVDKGLYVGEKKDGERHGHGTLTFSKRYYDFRKFPFIFKNDGYKYVGEFLDGEKNGQGTLTLPNGSTRYVGEWKDGERNGQGTTTFPNGNKYEGELKDGKKNGQGTYTQTDGGKFEGEWKDDKRWNGTQKLKSGQVIGKWVNGVKQ